MTLVNTMEYDSLIAEPWNAATYSRAYFLVNASMSASSVAASTSSQITGDTSFGEEMAGEETSEVLPLPLRVSPVPVRRKYGKPFVKRRRRDGRRFVTSIRFPSFWITFSRACCAELKSVRGVPSELLRGRGACDDVAASNNGQGVVPVEGKLPTRPPFMESSWLLLREYAIAFAVLEPDVEERLFLFLCIVRGWLLGVRLTGRGVTVQVDGALRGFAQPKPQASRL